MSAAIQGSKAEKVALKARRTAAKEWLRELKSKEVPAIAAGIAKFGGDHWFLRDGGGLGALLKLLKHKAPEARARRLRACVRACVCMCVVARMGACVRTCVRTCVRACMRVRVW